VTVRFSELPGWEDTKKLLTRLNRSLETFGPELWTTLPWKNRTSPALSSILMKCMPSGTWSMSFETYNEGTEPP
jgi:hypothetical protein